MTADINWQHARFDGEITFVEPRIRPVRSEEDKYLQILERLQEDMDESHEWVFPRSPQEIEKEADHHPDWVEHKLLPHIEIKDALRGGFEMSDP